MTSWTTTTLDAFNVVGNGGSVSGDPWFAFNPSTREVYLAAESRDRSGWTNINETTLWRGGQTGSNWSRRTVCSGVGTGFRVDKPSIAVGQAGIIPNTTGRYVYVADWVGDPAVIHLHYRNENNLDADNWEKVTFSDWAASTLIQGPVVLAQPTNKRVYLLWVDWTNNLIRAAELRWRDGALKLEAIGQHQSLPGRAFVTPINTSTDVTVPDLGLHSTTMPMAAINPADQSIGVVWHDWSGGRMNVRFSRFQPPAEGATNGSFGTPVTISDGSDHLFTPAITADGNGNYVVTYFASHKTPDGVIDGYETRASFINSTGGTLSTPAFSISNNVNPSPSSCMPSLGEYQGVAYSEGRFYAGSIKADTGAPPWKGDITDAVVAAYPASCTQATTFHIDKKSPMNGCVQSRTPLYKVHPGARVNLGFGVWNNANQPLSTDLFNMEWSNGINVVGTGATLTYTTEESTTLFLRVTSKADGSCDQIPIRIDVDKTRTPTTSQANSCGKMRSVRHNAMTPQPPGSPVTLEITPEAGETYEWYRSNASVQYQYFATGPTVTDYPTMTTTYWVEIDDGVAFEKHFNAQIPVCTPPSVTLPADRTIPLGTQTTINGSATGDPTLQYQWYTVSGGVPTVINGQTSPSLTTTPSATTTYRLIVTNSCGSGSDDIIVTAAGAPPSTPVMLGATYNPTTGFNEVSWQASSSAAGLNRYVVERLPDGQIMDVDPQHTTIYDAHNVIAGRAYAYRVKAVDNNNLQSPYSARDIATRMVFADDPIRAPNDNGGTIVRGVHVAELRRAVDAVRYAAGLAPAWSDYNNLTGTVFASQFTELRTRLNEARTVLGISSVTFTDVVSGTEMIRGRTVKELRDGVK